MRRITRYAPGAGSQPRGAPLHRQDQAPPAPQRRGPVALTQSSRHPPPQLPPSSRGSLPSHPTEENCAGTAVPAAPPSSGSVHRRGLVPLRAFCRLGEGRLLVGVVADVGVAGVGSRNLRAGVNVAVSKVLHPHLVPLVSEGDQETLETRGGRQRQGCVARGAPPRSLPSGAGPGSTTASLTQEKMEKKLKVMAARAESAPMCTSSARVQAHWLVKKQKPMNHRKVQRPAGRRWCEGPGLCPAAPGQVPRPVPAPTVLLAAMAGDGGQRSRPRLHGAHSSRQRVARGQHARRERLPLPGTGSHVTGQGQPL